MSASETRPTQEYFAAANGYTGFRSYFGEVFDTKSYERIFIIKGGPGTGKSSFMKKIASRIGELCDVEAILCSSDPKSYDGIILSRGEHKFAVIDGTAPHVRDAEIPGAIDTIINLGDNWDDRWLIGKRDEILALTNEKKRAYSAAYNYLNLAGSTKHYSERLLRENHLINLKSQAKSAAEELKCDRGATAVRLVSAFGRGGFVHLKTLESKAERIIGIAGDRDASMMLMRLIFDELDGFANLTVSPDVLDKKAIEALFIHDTKTLIRLGEAEKCISPKLHSAPTENEIMRTMARMHSDLLNEAQRWFGIAAEFHFRLEEIYGSAMDYSKNDQICDLTVEKIASAVERC